VILSSSNIATTLNDVSISKEVVDNHAKDDRFQFCLAWII